MKHFVLFKFKEEVDKDHVYKLFTDTYKQIDNELDFVSEVRVSLNCYDRPSNYDMMIEITVSAPERLTDYLEYPVHKELAVKTRPYMESVVMFDYQ